MFCFSYNVQNMNCNKKFINKPPTLSAINTKQD